MTGTALQSGQVGGAGMVVIGYIIIVLVVALAIPVADRLRKIDRKFARRREVNGVVKKKYLEFMSEHGCFEVEDTPEARSKRGMTFIAEVYCGGKKNFRCEVLEDLYDRLEEGDVFPVTYEEGYMRGNCRVTDAPTTAWEWEKAMDHTAETAQL